MRRSRSRRPLAWSLAILAVGFAVWLLLEGGAATRRSTTAGDPAESATARQVPELLPAERPRPASASTRVPKASGQPPAKDKTTREGGKRAAGARRVTIRVVDAVGRPIHRAWITVRVREPGSETVGEREWQTRRDGRARFEPPAGRVIGVWVDAPLRGRRRLLAIEDPRGIDLARIGEVRAEALLVLAVRTVDRARRPRAKQRILYRPREEKEQATGWWGATSDTEGWCRLGPFAAGARVELLPGPRGLSSAQIADPAGWQAVYVDDTPVELVVDEAPRLRLAFMGVPLQALLRITVLDADTGERLFPTAQWKATGEAWTAPALTADRRLEVVVHEPGRGQYARLHDVVPSHQPLAVELLPGFTLTGTIVGPPPEWRLDGIIAVVGRGFKTHHILGVIGDRDRFVFRGLPDEPFQVMVQVSAPEIGQKWLYGCTWRRDERNVRIPVREAVQIVGRFVLEGVGGGSHWRPRLCVARSPDWPADVRNDPLAAPGFRFELPVGRWRIVARGTAPDGTSVSGELDLGHVQSDCDGVVVYVR